MATVLTRALDTARPGPYTGADLDDLPETSRIEVLDGSIVVNPQPVARHQFVEMRLMRVLNDLLPSSLTAIGGVGLEIASDQQPAPDAVIVPTAVATATRKTVAPNEVLLVAEIISAWGRKRDTIYKPSIYASAGIPLYLLIDPLTDPWPLVVAYELAEGGDYREMSRADPGRTLRLPAPLSIAFDPRLLAER